MICCINNPNAYICTFCKRWSFIDGAFSLWVSLTLQTHHVDSTLKRCGNGRFHVVSTWNPRGVFVGKENCFQKTKVTETGLSDFHKLISTFLRLHFLNLKRFITEIIKNLMSKSFSKTLKTQTFISIQTTQTIIMN